MSNLDELFRWQAFWMYISSDWAVEFARPLWLPAAWMPEFQGRLRKIIEPWVDPDYDEPFARAHFFLLREAKAMGGYEFLEALQTWRERVFEGNNRRASEGMWVWILLHREHGRFLINPPAGLIEPVDSIRAELINSPERALVSAYSEQALSEWDLSISTRYEGSNPKNYLQPLTDNIIGANVFVRSWAQNLAEASSEQLDELFQMALERREELGLAGVYITFPGLWTLELARYLA